MKQKCVLIENLNLVLELEIIYFFTLVFLLYLQFSLLLGKKVEQLFL